MGALLQISLLKPYRRQAMAMPEIKSYIIVLFLALIYLGSFFCQKYIKSFIPIYFAIALQLLLIGYTIHIYIFCWNLEEGNISKDDFDSDYFPPIDINYYIIAFFSIVIIGFGFRKIKTDSAVLQSLTTNESKLK